MAKNAKDFDCDSCKWGRHCDRDGLLPGSQGPAGFPQWEIPGLIVSDVCLKPMLTPESHTWLRFHKHYQSHLLPDAGGLLDQPNAYLRAMEIIEAALHE